MRTRLPAFLILASVTLTVQSAFAAEARGAICDTRARITALAYYSSGAYHGAMDQGMGACFTYDSSSARYHRAMINQSRYWSYRGGCGVFCGNHLGNTCNGGAGNYIKTTGSNGYTFQQMHINALSGYSNSKTCTRCAFGLLGSTGNSSAGHVHGDNRRYGTKITGWLKGKSVGQSAYCGYTMGYPTL